MKFKNQLNIIALVGVMLITSCNKTKKENVLQDDGGELIAQTNTNPRKVERKLSIMRLISNDVAFSKLVSAVKTSDMYGVLTANEAYTILAPTNVAFNKLPDATQKDLLLPENKEKLQSILNCHLIKGVVTSSSIVDAVKEGRGIYKIKTIGGATLMASLKGDRLVLIDEMGNGATMVTRDVEASNGLIHTIDAVMMPKK